MADGLRGAPSVEALGPAVPGGDAAVHVDGEHGGVDRIEQLRAEARALLGGVPRRHVVVLHAGDWISTGR